MSVTVQIEAKVVGQKKPVFSDWRIPIPPKEGSGGMTLRDLITAIVSDEVQAFQQRQEQRRLARVLSPEQIEAGAARGKIELGESELKQEVGEAAAIGTALQAFEDGLYFVFIDDVQQMALDQQVFVHDASRVLFVRLVALVGG
ncbi:MAG: hypothetical protein ABI700_06990 [Chloroflexota bacterium]